MRKSKDLSSKSKKSNKTKTKIHPETKIGDSEDKKLSKTDTLTIDE